MKRELYESIDKNWGRFSKGKRPLNETNFANVLSDLKETEDEVKKLAKLQKEIPEFKNAIAAAKKGQKLKGVDLDASIENSDSKLYLDVISDPKQTAKLKAILKPFFTVSYTDLASKSGDPEDSFQFKSKKAFPMLEDEIGYRSFN